MAIPAANGARASVRYNAKWQGVAEVA